MEFKINVYDENGNQLDGYSNWHFTKNSMMIDIHLVDQFDILTASNDEIIDRIDNGASVGGGVIFIGNYRDMELLCDKLNLQKYLKHRNALNVLDVCIYNVGDEITNQNYLNIYKLRNLVKNCKEKV